MLGPWTGLEGPTELLAKYTVTRHLQLRIDMAATFSCRDMPNSDPPY